MVGAPCIASWLRRFDLCTLAGMRQAADEAGDTLRDLSEHAEPSERVAIAIRRARVALERRDLAAARAQAESALSTANEIGDDRLLSV